MIKVNLKEKDNKIKEIKITGHALYDDFGKDIVCASVSSIVITTVNAILNIDEDAISYDEEGFTILVLKDDFVTCSLIDNMISLLRELEDDYPKNIKFI